MILIDCFFFWEEINAGNGSKGLEGNAKNSLEGLEIDATDAGWEIFICSLGFKMRCTFQLNTSNNAIRFVNIIPIV